MYLPEKIRSAIGQRKHQIDTVGLSGAGVYSYDDIVLKVQKISPEAENELSMLAWLSNKLSVPRIHEHIIENGYMYIIMDKCSGMMACDPYFMERPQQQIKLLARSLHQLWSVDIEDCPCAWPLHKLLHIAEDNVINHRVDIKNAQPDTFGPKGFCCPEKLLQWLKDNQPKQCSVLSHGDFCLPNVFLSNNGVIGYIDLGRCGASDPWRDIALCCRSLENNYNGVYSGKQYSGYNRQQLFDELEIHPDEELLRYYILLDELF